MSVGQCQKYPVCPQTGWRGDCAGVISNDGQTVRALVGKALYAYGYHAERDMWDNQNLLIGTQMIYLNRDELWRVKSRTLFDRWDNDYFLYRFLARGGRGGEDGQSGADDVNKPFHECEIVPAKLHSATAEMQKYGITRKGQKTPSDATRRAVAKKQCNRWVKKGAGTRPCGGRMCSQFSF